MADLSIDVNGMHFTNPFVIGSGPPGTNYKTIAKCFRVGWGGVVAKTISLDTTEVMNVAPRYGKLRTDDGKSVVGFQNIELISEKTEQYWLQSIRELKRDFPDQILK